MLEQARDATDLRGHAGGDHDRCSAPGRHHGAGVEKRVTIAERSATRLNTAHPLLNWQALAGERRLLGGEGKGFDEPGIGRHVVTRLDLDAISGHEFAGRNRTWCSIADDAGQRRRHPAEGRQCPLGAVLLQEADDGVDQHDRHDRGCVGPVAHGPRDDRRRDQDPDHQLPELGQEGPPPRHRLRLLERVGAIGHQPPDGVFGGQPSQRVGRQSLDDVVERERVPGGRQCCSAGQ